MHTVWWRDDDAGRDDPKLERLLDLARVRSRPVALAVVPDWLEPVTAARILACPMATVLQHGVAHADHGEPGNKTIELGGSADRGALARDLVAGRERLEAAFGDRFLPVLVPPWNRVDPDVVALAPALGFTGISCFGEPPTRADLVRVDVHVDAIDWHGSGRPFPVATIEGALDDQLAAAAGAPVGLMTHHQVLDGCDWDDLDRLLRFGHDAGVRWVPAKAMFGDA